MRWWRFCRSSLCGLRRGVGHLGSVSAGEPIAGAVDYSRRLCDFPRGVRFPLLGPTPRNVIRSEVDLICGWVPAALRPNPITQAYVSVQELVTKFRKVSEARYQLDCYPACGWSRAGAQSQHLSGTSSLEEKLAFTSCRCASPALTTVIGWVATTPSANANPPGPSHARPQGSAHLT